MCPNKQDTAGIQYLPTFLKAFSRSGVFFPGRGEQKPCLPGCQNNERVSSMSNSSSTSPTLFDGGTDDLLTPLSVDDKLKMSSSRMASVNSLYTTQATTTQYVLQRTNKNNCTVDQELAGVAEQVSKSFVFTHQVAASPREIIGHGRHLEIIHHFGNLTLPVDAYFLEEYSCQISYPSKLKQRSLQLF